ncbi:MAG: crossover junction endodeoxyribonuclease RuvC [Proteobacteria bacterium]|nr:crossover junction endodeoxyribonuclease RuvC [Pseudomonadota bacterium]
MSSTDSFRILGLDPGSRITGFGILELPRGIVNIKKIRLVAVGVLKCKATLAHSERTGYLHDAVYQLAAKYCPEICVIERAFTGINPLSALRLGETRGALIAAVRRLDVRVAEIAATEVKKTITGHGHASKEQLAMALQYLLHFDRAELPLDASDAVAIGLSYGLSL